MFDVTWMSYFSALSSQMQKAHNLEVNKLCLEGMKLATKIACVFELSTPREAFISALRNTTHLNNPQDMLAKNIEALKVLLELGQTEGNLLAESWKDILMCISQLDRLQLITGGVDESAVPDVSQARFTRTDTSDSRSSNQSRQRTRQRSGTGSRGFSNEIALESRSDEFIRSVDRIFTNTANLSGEAMVHFAKALTEVSWDEIKVSGSNDSPRTYSLQKIVEISYYNMNRVRFEWSNIWDVLGEHFNQVGCHNNMNIVFFALDSLRQLSMRFMEIEELAGFKFQKDFLKPFEHVLANSHNITVKDMVLRCLIQMIQARGDNIRSGWRTMFGVFTVAAREPHESIVNLAYENVNQVYRTKFGVVITQGAFTDLIVCLTEFSKNLKFQKKSLAALELLKSIVPTMLKTPECPLSQIPRKGESATKAADGATKSVPTKTSVEEGYWFPVLFAFHDVLMTGEDLEVRSNALEYFFAALVKYGGDFTPEFWDILWRQQLYPIFMVLRSRPELTNVLNHEELSVWLSTTMIQALRNMITLFTHYFDALEHMLDRFLELLALCICQENDTISRIGSNCLQQLILKNVTKFTTEHWARIVGAFCELFERTTAYQLFTAANPNSAASLSLQSNGFDFSGGLTASFTPWDQMKGGDFSGVVFPGPRDVISQAGPNSKWYGAGVAIQVTVTNRFAVAVNAIVRQAGFAISSNIIEGVDLPNTATDERKYFIETEDTHAYYMDLPLLVRFYGKSHRKEGKRWFVEAGGTMRHVWNVKTSITTETIDGVSCCINTPTRPHKQNALGATVGAGMHFADDFGIRIIPEVRYTRWLNETFQKYGAHSRRDQVEIMITIGF